jgi:hypothetical protein
MKKKITEKQFFRFLPKYQKLLQGSTKRFGEDGAHKQALCLAAMEFAKQDPEQFRFNYEELPVLWFSQDKMFCKFFCSLADRKDHGRAIALMPFDRGALKSLIEADPKNSERIPFDLFFDFDWVANVAVFFEPRILCCIPSEAHQDPDLLKHIERMFCHLGDGDLEDIRKKWVLYLMPNNPIPHQQEAAENSIAQAFIRMLSAPCFKERIKNHPQGLSEII